MQQIGIFDSRALRELQGLSRELQSQVNNELLETLCDIEQQEWAHYGKVRSAMEKRLKGE